MNEIHEHITIEDLRFYHKLGVENSEPNVDELDRFFEIENKIAVCQSCCERYHFAKDVEALFGDPIWVCHDFLKDLDQK